MLRIRRDKSMAILMAFSVFIGSVSGASWNTPAHADGWSELAKPILQQVVVPGLTQGFKIWKERQEKKKRDESSSDVIEVPPEATASDTGPDSAPITINWDGASPATDTQQSSPPPLSAS